MNEVNEGQLDAFVRHWSSDNMPSVEELETAARVCIKLADACENTMNWWQRIFFSASEMRNSGRKCAEMAIRFRSMNINMPNKTFTGDEPVAGEAYSGRTGST